MDRFIIVSADCHAGLPLRRYRDYLDPQYRELMDQAAPIELELANKAAESFLIKDVNDEWRRGNERGLSGAWDHDRRVAVLDEDGVAAEVIFPDGVTESNMPPFGAGLGLDTGDEIDPALQWAGARAHNRWLAELCAQAPERHVGVAIVPLVWNVDEAIQEARWAREHGLRGVLLPNLTRSHKSYNHVCYHPFWRACEDLRLVVHFHSGAAPREQFFGPGWPSESSDAYVGGVGCYISEIVFWTCRPVTFLIWGGVFEKFPDLRVAITETGTTWAIPPWLRLLDHHYHDADFSRKMGDGYKRQLSMPPSAYFHRNVAIGASCITRNDAELYGETGLKRLMWGTDYPHPEGTWPRTRAELSGTFSGLPTEHVAAMLGENAIDFYRLDRAALSELAERIGPSRAELSA